MIQIGSTLVSEDLLEKQFTCNLNACKGECCVKGDAGAPVTGKEREILSDIFPVLKKYLRKEGIAAIEKDGVCTTNDAGEHETTLVEGKECAYVIFDEEGTAFCGIEKAYNERAVTFQKPISCHLYPVRIQDYSEFSAVNYHHWPICEAACTLGESLKMPVYRFVKEALIRRFGKDWYRELELVAAHYKP